MNHIITDIDLDENSECIICMEEFIVGDLSLITSCGHVYHKDCIQKWQTKNVTCPICRKTYNNNSFDKEIIEKWIEKGKNLGNIDNGIIEKLSNKILKKLLDNLDINYKGCLERKELLKKYKAYMNNIEIKKIIKFFQQKNVNYFNCIEVNDIKNLYEIYIIRTLC